MQILREEVENKTLMAESLAGPSAEVADAG
jgi:hypothetical protein